MFHGTFSLGLLYRKQLRHGAQGHTWLPSLPNILPGSSGQTADRPSWKVEDLSFCWKRQQRKKKITLAMKIAASLFHSWKFSTSGSCAYRVFCRSLQAKLKYNFNWVKLKPFWLWTPPHFQKTLWFSLDETHHNCKYHVKNISKVAVIQCNLN